MDRARHWRVALVPTLAVAIAAVLGAPATAGDRDRDEDDLRRKNVLGVYAGARTDSGGRVEVVITLGRKKEATLETRSRAGRRTHRGEWEFDRERELVTLNLTSGNRGSLTFRADGRRLRATQWDRSVWGSAAWDLPRRSDLDADDYEDFLGTWSHSRPGAAGRQHLLLVLERGGAASLRQRFENRAGADIVSTGRWVRRGDGNLDVTLRRGASTEAFTFRPDGDRLEPITWNRQNWGSTPPRFGRLSPRPSGDEAEPGAYWARAVAGRTLRLELLRGGQARMNVTHPSRRPPIADVLYTGTWRRLGGERIEVRMTRSGGERADFELRREDEDLVATSWDREEWGPQAPRFRSGVGAEANDGTAGRYFARRSVGGQTRILTLTLEEGGRASLRVETVGRGEPETFTGTWEETRSGRVLVDVARGGTQHDFALRVEGDRLVATSWDREEFGSQPLEFERAGVLRR